MPFITPLKTLTLFIITLFLTGCASDGHLNRWSQCALIGAGTGGLVGAAANSTSSSDRGKSAAYGAIGGALVGTAICALTGSDSDHDGVPDSKDRCADTPKGITVDHSGCPVDSDNDGVPDYLDKCANTPYGVTVDAHGCPDSDGDGVPDNMDRCPNTPVDMAVNQYGCPIDSDGDGVPDDIDKCPDTPEGIPVDADGCPLQRELGMVYFGFDKADIDPPGRQALDKIADVAKQQSDIHLTAVGYTDSTGPLEHNRKLALRRAESVKQYLEERGVNGNRIKAVAGGVLESGDQTREGRRNNRHVTISIEG
ncbi:OmpA family protein [Endozoicomonas acroporae]|uniref:OmpA family protein n=1 Tax=Endozoicomonas acroporae TaxID=1701104 RepID=UPI000C77AAE4|nr:OmpA family protein [Endozoicomonas acroporae]